MGILHTVSKGYMHLSPLNPLESMCENIFHLIYFILSLNEDRGIFICFTMKHFCGQLSIRWTNSTVFVQLNRQNLNQRRVDSSVPMSRFLLNILKIFCPTGQCHGHLTVKVYTSIQHFLDQF